MTIKVMKNRNLAIADVDAEVLADVVIISL